ncbi:hypothetical protein VE03_07405 [Pseudogymnoascus sp. 23342-1-I1]|nr:hypothetical protein VE03_07405 [Pseudogymnoascus sp. 23342-1-I1]
MALTTRNQARRQSETQSELIPLRKPEDIRENPGNPNRVEEYATMYPVFITAPVLLEILDELIEESQKGLNDMIGGTPTGSKEGPPMECLCFLETMDLNSVVRGSRKPMQPFESPFIGWTDDECRSWMNEHRHPSFATYTFVVLDKDTVKNKTCRIGYTYVDKPKGDQMLITDFYTCMHSMPALEISEMDWEENKLVGTGEVDSREMFEEDRRKARETYEEMELERKQEEARNLPRIHL